MELDGLAGLVVGHWAITVQLCRDRLSLISWHAGDIAHIYCQQEHNVVRGAVWVVMLVQLVHEDNSYQASHNSTAGRIPYRL